MAKLFSKDAAPTAAGSPEAAKQVKPASPRAKELRANRIVRLAIQIVFLVLAPQAFSMAFSGARYLFVCFGAGDPVELTRFVMLLLVLMVGTVLAGRFFCGYLCAFGAVGDILYQLGNAVAKRLHIKRNPLPDKVENALRKVKYAVLVGVLAACALGASSVVSAASPWTAFGRLTNLQVMQMGVLGTVLLLLIAVGMVWKERFFCEFLCPLGALFSLLPLMPWANHRKDDAVCNGCNTCKRACPVNILPPGEGKQTGECISCGRCEIVCPQGCVSLGTVKNAAVGAGAADTSAALGALGAASDVAGGNDSAKAGKAAVGKAPRPAKQRLVRIVVLAVVFFVLFWLMGAVSYLPTIDLFTQAA